jgi:AraC-like DNA-binding protein
MPETYHRGATPTAAGKLVSAAARRFAAGYDATSTHQIAADAGLDPAVSLYLGTKEQLFSQVAAALINPAKVLATVSEDPPDRAGERLLRYFLSLLGDISQPGTILDLIRAAVASEQAASLLRQFLAEQVHGPIAATLRASQPELRAALLASQLVGIAITRQAVGLAPLTAADPDELAAWITPVVHYYMTGHGAHQAAAPVTWQERFRLALAGAFEDGSPSLGTLARRLAVSPRTLQRQLAAHGTTWRAELDTARQRRAWQARQGGADMASLARQLGYADARSARRAVRRWDARSG